jgi:serine/threonine protein kinase
MPLSPGTRIAHRQAQGDLEQGRKVGPSEVTSLRGEGGMGEAYRATDPKLKREVAIKVLPTGRR